MKADKKMPTVVIVGRTNVGKSTLFNRLSKDAQSITYDIPGVTRDIVSDVVQWQDCWFRLMDTGGLITEKSKDAIEKEVQKRALSAIETADCILFVVDGAAGLLAEDYFVAQIIRKKAGEALLVVNKNDCASTQGHLSDFESLGFPIYTISAVHKRGIEALVDAVVKHIPNVFSEEMEKPAYRVAIIGKPNVGKSSLMNQLLKKERAIVADMPGTTREAISDVVTFYQEDIKLTDTPGIRRKRGVTESLEQLMVKSSLRSIDAAHIVVLVVDGSAGIISDQELKLAFYAFEEKHKALIILLNKSDLMTDEEYTSLEQQSSLYNQLMKKVLTVAVSCKTGKNIGKIVPLLHTLWERARIVIPDHELTMFFNELLMHKPLYKAGQALTFRRAQQIKKAPLTIQLKVGNPPAWERTQLNFLDNQLRTRYNLKGIPVVFVVEKS